MITLLDSSKTHVKHNKQEKNEPNSANKNADLHLNPSFVHLVFKTNHHMRISIPLMYSQQSGSVRSRLLHSTCEPEP